MNAAQRWRELVGLAEAKRIPDAASLTPRGLAWARSGRHPHGTELPQLPASYLAFIDELGGYPMFGLGYYDRQGFSFLPPSPMAVLSADVFDAQGVQPKRAKGAPTRAHAAFFAGYDLSDIEGWAFAPGGEVWSVERSMLSEPDGDFDSWAEELFTSSCERLSEADEAQLDEWRAEVAAETDPHRLFDYSLKTAPIPKQRG